MPLKTLNDGWRLLAHHKKAVIYFYLANFFIAGLILVPFMEVFDESLGPGFYREKLVRALDYDWYRLFQERSGGFVSTFSVSVIGAGPFVRNLQYLLDGKLTDFPPVIVSLGALYLLLNAFLMAGAVVSFAWDSNGTTTREFLRNGGVFFGRFFRLTLLALAAYWLLGSWIVEPLTDLTNHLSSRALTDRGAFFWRFSTYLLVLPLFLVINMMFDYARIKTAAEDRTSVVLAFFSSVDFCVRHFRATFAFYLLVLGLGVCWVGLYLGIEYLLPQQSALSILVAFLWQQIFIVGRLSLKLLFYTGQMQLYLKKRGPL